tara:strand:+ start:2354 stop:2959 length:606 start_codon:yes stop_codon:yes gene_type:complete
LPTSTADIATLSRHWLEACRDFGVEVVASYKTGKKPRSKRLQLRGKPTIHNDADVQAMGRRCEVGVCLILGLDPRTSLNWNRQECDPGEDFKFHGTSVDVKGTDNPRAERLFWPVQKKEFFEDFAADVLVFAKNGVGDNVNKVWAPTWTTKDEFRAYRKTARNEPGIIDGTWYMYRNVTVAGMHPIGNLELHVKSLKRWMK